MSRAWTDMVLEGTELRLSEGAGGPVLVLLHGIGSNMTSFDGLSALLPEDWTLAAWNAPGYGGSQPLSADWPVAADYAGRLSAVLDAAGMNRVLLAGHSLGTLMAVSFARLHPDRVAGLVLLACAQGHGAAPGILGEKAQARLDDLAAMGPEEFARSRAPRLMYRPDAMPAVRDKAIAAMSAIRPVGYGQAVRMLATGDQKGDAESVRVPSLVMVGEKDAVTAPEQSRGVHDALARAAPDLPHVFRSAPDAGHILHQEFPEAVGAEIVRFEASLAGAREAAR